MGRDTSTQASIIAGVGIWAVNWDDKPLVECCLQSGYRVHDLDEGDAQEDERLVVVRVLKVAGGVQP